MRDHWAAIRDPIMQLRQSNTLEKIEWAGDEVGSEVPTQPASRYPWDFSSPNRDEVLALLKPDGDRERTIWLVAVALVADFGLGWACRAIAQQFVRAARGACQLPADDGGARRIV